MEKQLISEITRIHEIMGITSKKILLEQKGGLIDAGLAFLGTIMKGFDNGLIKGIGRITRQSFEDRAAQVLKRVEDGLPLSPAEQRFYSRIVSSTLPDLTRATFNDSFIPAVRAIGEQIPGLGEQNMLIALRNPKATDDQVVDALWKSYGGGTKNPLIPNLTKEDLMAFRKMEMANIRPDDTPIVLPKKRPPSDNITPTPKKDDIAPTPPKDEPSPEDMPPPDEGGTPPPREEPTPDDIPPPDEGGTPPIARSNVESYIDETLELIPDITPEELARLRKLNRGWLKKWRGFLNTILDNFWRTNNKLLDELAVLLKSYPTLQPTEQTDAFERIGDLVLLLSKNEDNLFKDIDNFMNREIRDYDYSLYNKVRSDNRWATARSLTDGTWRKKYDEQFSGYLTRKGKLRNQLMSLLFPTSWLPTKKFKNKWNKVRYTNKDGKVIELTGETYLDAVANKWKSIFESPDWAEFRAYWRSGTTMPKDQWAEFVRAHSLPRVFWEIPWEWARSIALYTSLVAGYEFLTGLISDVLDVEGDYPILSGEKNKRFDKLMKIDPNMTPSQNPWITAVKGMWQGLKGATQYFLDSLDPVIGIPPGFAKAFYELDRLIENPEHRESIVAMKDRTINLAGRLRDWFMGVEKKAEQRAEQVIDQVTPKKPEEYTADEPGGIARDWCLNDETGGGMVQVGTITEVPGYDGKRWVIKEKDSNYTVMITFEDDKKTIKKVTTVVKPD